MSLCFVCWSREWVGRTPGSSGKSGSLFFFFFVMAGEAMERQFTPETSLPPCNGKQKGPFLWGAQWRGRRLRICECQGCCYCRLSASPPQLWCPCKPFQDWNVCILTHCFSTAACCCNTVSSDLQWLVIFCESVMRHWEQKVYSLKTRWVIWSRLDMLHSRLKYHTKLNWRCA